MTKKLLFILLFIISMYSLKAQNETANTNRVYISLKQYKKLYKVSLSKMDSLNFIYRNNDTLVRVENYKRPKGVSVPYQYKDSTFLSHYKKVAFNHRNDSSQQETTMKYWKEPIKIFFSKSINGKTKRKFIKFALQISKEVDSLNISIVKKFEDSNYVIYYNNDFEYESRMINYKYTDYYISWNRKNQIYRGALKLNIDNLFNEKLKLQQLKDYFFRSLGYFKLSNDFVCKSYFADCYSDEKKLLSFDIELLKYHYSYGICKGTSLAIFEEQHEKSKEVFRKTNHFVNFIHTD